MDGQSLPREMLGDSLGRIAMRAYTVAHRANLLLRHAAGEESKDDDDEDEGAFDVSKVKDRLAKKGARRGGKKGGEEPAKKKKDAEKKPRQKVGCAAASSY